MNQLEYFCRNYLYQDWSLSQIWPQPLEEFLHNEMTVVLSGFLVELKNLPTETETERELQQRLLSDYEAHFAPIDVGLTWKSWLLSLEHAVRRELERRLEVPSPG